MCTCGHYDYMHEKEGNKCIGNNDDCDCTNFVYIGGED